MRVEEVHIGQHATGSSLAAVQIPRTMRIVDRVDMERTQVKKAADIGFVRFRRAYAVEAELTTDVGHTQRTLAALGIVQPVEMIDAETSETALSFGTCA
jgi:hypothetical protein